MDYNYWGNDEDRYEDDDEMMMEDDEEFEQKPVLSHLQASTNYRIPLVREVMLAAQQASASYTIRDRPSTATATATAMPTSPLDGGNATIMCAVCGDGHAKLHYGVLACYGCKGFFRRTLTGKYRYACRFGNNCVVDKYQRNSCRYCRFQRCIEVGMDPKAVRPDRDPTGNQRTPRARKMKVADDLLAHMIRLQSDDWTKKLPVEVRILLMQLMNIEAKVVKGDDTVAEGIKKETLAEKRAVSLRDMFESKPIVDGRTEMSYEPFRMAKVEELSQIAHRRAIAAVDWVDSLSELGELADTEDKVIMVKNCYSPLTIFNFSVRTAQNTKDSNILCLAGRYFVPRRLPPEFNEQNQLSDNLIDRCLNELVAPLRKLNLREEEIVPLKAIIILDPNAKGLSEDTRNHVNDLRDKVQDLLFQVVKESTQGFTASSRFGNLLLLLPTISNLSNVMSENMSMCQALGSRAAGDPLLAEMFGDFKLDDPRLASSVSPPMLFENPADITLDQSSSTSPLPEPGPVKSSRMSRRSDASTQTEGTLNSTSLLGSFSPGHDMGDDFFGLLDHIQSDGPLIDLNLDCSITDDFLQFCTDDSI